MEPKPASGELVKAEPRGVVITTPSEYATYLAKKQSERAHILSPATDIGALPPQWALVPSVVQINPDPQSGDVYRDPLFCEDGEVAIAKPGLRKLARAGGLSWTTRRLDSNSLQYYWSIQATVTYRGLDGTMKTAEATAEYDLRDGSPRINKIRKAAERKKRDATAQIEGMRMHGLRGCEARAVNAAIREFGVRQKYTQKELEKPFVCFNLVFQPDMRDPQQKAMVTQAALTNTALLYGQTDAPSTPPRHAEGVILDQGPGPDDSTPQDQPFEPATPPAEQRPVYTVSGVFKLAGGGFAATTFETKDEKLLITDEKLATAAYGFHKQSAPVHLEIRRDERGAHLVSVTPAQLPDEGSY